MSIKSIITIGRSYGSGGREIGRRLAKDLEIPFYDKELLKLAAKESGMNEEYLQKADEKAMNRVLYSLYAGGPYPMGMHMNNLNNMPLNDRLFITQAGLIRRFAEQGPCILIGRCASYILRDRPDVVSLFVTAPLEARVRRIRRINPDLTEAQAESQIKRVDKQRREYFSTYTDCGWDSCGSYDLTLDASKLGILRTVDFIKDYIALRESVRG